MSRQAPGIVEFGAQVRGSPSAMALILANLVPLFGVLFAGWSAFEIVWLFWFENAIVGAFSLLKMLTVGVLCDPRDEGAGVARPSGPRRRILAFAGVLFLSGFFMVHYGFFNFIHGVFVVSLLGKGSGFLDGDPGLRMLYVDNVAVAVRRGLGPAMLALIGSHAVSFVANFLVRREYARADIGRLLFGPYGRVGVLHMAILLGAFAALALGSPIGVLALLVAGKTALDLAFHLLERKHDGAIPLRPGRGSARARARRSGP